MELFHDVDYEEWNFYCCAEAFLFVLCIHFCVVKTDIIIRNKAMILTPTDR